MTTPKVSHFSREVAPALTTLPLGAPGAAALDRNANQRNLTPTKGDEFTSLHTVFTLQQWRVPPNNQSASRNDKST